MNDRLAAICQGDSRFVGFGSVHPLDGEVVRARYESLYTVKDEDRVVKVLIAYKSNFLDKLADKVLNTWMETRFNREKD